MKAIALPMLVIATLTTGSAHTTPLRAEQLLSTALELEPNQQRGAELYAKQCSACHAERAQGNPDKLIPSLAGQRRNYLLKQLADFAELDRAATQMHLVVARKDVREPQAWADLAAYLNRLPPTGQPASGNGEFVSLGEASYRQWCSSCHEEDARGDDEGFVPSLRDQHYAYLLAQMRGLSAGHRVNVDPELVRFIDSLDSDEMSGIADYLSRMHGAVRDRAKLKDDGSLSE